MLTIYNGSSYKIYGWEPPYNIVVNNDVHALNSLQFQFDKTIDNIFVSIGDHVNFIGLSTLTASGVTVDGNFINGGNVELSARNDVNLKPGFHAKNGCEVHIYNEPLFVNCTDIESLGFRQEELIVSNTFDPNGYQSTREFEVNFHKLNEVQYFNVFPNPAHHSITVEILMHSSEINGLKEVYFVDLTGREVSHHQFTSSRFEINIQNLTPGIYFVKVNSNSKISTKKLIVYQYNKP